MERETDLVERPGVSVVEHLHALDQNLLGLLPGERVLSTLDGFAEQRLRAKGGKVDQRRDSEVSENQG